VRDVIVLRHFAAAILFVIALFNVGFAFWAYAVSMRGDLHVRGGPLGIIGGIAITLLTLRGSWVLTRSAVGRTDHRSAP